MGQVNGPPTSPGINASPAWTATSPLSTAGFTDLGRDHKINGLDANAFGSRHTGGAQFAYCDGSVHFLSQSISVWDGVEAAGQAVRPWGVFDRMGARNDGMVVETPE